MSEIKRLELAYEDGAVGIRASPNGDYMLYTDHLAAVSEKDKTILHYEVNVCPELEREIGDHKETIYQWAEIHNNDLEKIAALTARVKELEATHDWYCGCGHWNGPNLSVCALCGRTPGESRH